MYKCIGFPTELCTDFLVDGYVCLQTEGRIEHLRLAENV